MTFKRLLLNVNLLFSILYASAQGSKNYVSVRFADSALINFALQATICDSFTTVMQNEKLLFYEKSYRTHLFELTTGEILETKHLLPRKLLIEGDTVITYYNLNDKLLFRQSQKSKLHQIPLLLLNKLKFDEFSFSNETKLISGVLCSKAIGLGPDGDTTIIWMQKNSSSNNLKTIFNSYFTDPPIQPILEFSMKNFQMQNAVVAELTYSIYSFELGDFSKDFKLLSSYKLSTQEGIDAEMEIISDRLWEEYKKKKKN